MRVALLLTLLALAGPVRAADDPAAEARALANPAIWLLRSPSTIG